MVYSYVLTGYRTLRARGVIETVRRLYLSIVQKAYSLVLRTPQGRKKLREELATARKDLKAKLIDEKESKVTELGKYTRLPETGKSRSDINSMFEVLERIHKADWEQGKVRWVEPRLLGFIRADEQTTLAAARSITDTSREQNSVSLSTMVRAVILICSYTC